MIGALIGIQEEEEREMRERERVREFGGITERVNEERLARIEAMTREERVRGHPGIVINDWDLSDLCTELRLAWRMIDMMAERTDG